MSRPLRIQYPGAVYHVTHRGNERGLIFRDDADRRQFLVLLSRSLVNYDVILHSYVLMDNHFHLLTETPLGNLSEFMRHFNISYTNYYNRRHDRAGNLYQGRFKSLLIDNEVYLSAVSRYIHLSPARIGGMQDKDQVERFALLLDYPWSSLPGYLSTQKRQDFVTYGPALEEYGGDTPAGRAEYKRRLGIDLSEGLVVREKIIGQSIMGDERFVERVRKKLLPDKNDRERPAVGTIRQHKKKDDLLRIVAAKLEEPLETLLHRPGLPRQMTMDILYRYGGLKNPDIGALMGVDYSTVSQGRKRLRERVAADAKLQKLLAELEYLCR